MFTVSTLRYDGKILMEPGFLGRKTADPLEESPSLEETMYKIVIQHFMKSNLEA